MKSNKNKKNKKKPETNEQDQQPQPQPQPQQMSAGDVMNNLFKNMDQVIFSKGLARKRRAQTARIVAKAAYDLGLQVGRQVVTREVMPKFEKAVKALEDIATQTSDSFAGYNNLISIAKRTLDELEPKQSMQPEQPEKNDKDEENVETAEKENQKQ